MLMLEPSCKGLLYLGHGSSCVVLDWGDDDKWVVKTFYSEYQARDALAYHQRCLKADLAPAIYDGRIFRIWTGEELPSEWDHGKWRYAYICERVDTDHGVDCGDNYPGDCHDHEGGDSEFHILCMEMAENGFSTYDMCAANVGRRADGKLVPLDFGEESR